MGAELSPKCDLCAPHRSRAIKLSKDDIESLDFSSDKPTGSRGKKNTGQSRTPLSKPLAPPRNLRLRHKLVIFARLTSVVLVFYVRKMMQAGNSLSGITIDPSILASATSSALFAWTIDLSLITPVRTFSSTTTAYDNSNSTGTSDKPINVDVPDIDTSDDALRARCICELQHEVHWLNEGSDSSFVIEPGPSLVRLSLQEEFYI
ncbi:hypothetical protein ACLMJK_008649 [Lecanora helva]